MFLTNPTVVTNASAIEYLKQQQTGTVVAVGVFDALTSGNLLAYSTITSSKTIDSGMFSNKRRKFRHYLA